MNFINGQSKPNLTQITKSESKPIQPRNSNPNHIQSPNLKTKKKKKKDNNKNNNFTDYGVMGMHPISSCFPDYISAYEDLNNSLFLSL